MQRRTYRRLDRHRDLGIEKLLGALEAEIMDLLWQQPDNFTVRDVLTKINAHRARSVAYTTVMTVMARLAEKGLLQRIMVGTTHVYRVRQTREDFLQGTSDKIVEELIADFGEVAIASFLAALEQVDPQRLLQLRRYLESQERR